QQGDAERPDPASVSPCLPVAFSGADRRPTQFWAQKHISLADVLHGCTIHSLIIHTWRFCMPSSKRLVRPVLVSLLLTSVMAVAAGCGRAPAAAAPAFPPP